MPNNILIVGAAGAGKTTLIKRLLKDLTPLVVRGFYKEPIIEFNIIKGYSVITLDLKWQILAHVDIEGPDRIENIGVNIDGFEQLVLPQLSLFAGTELFIIDEIGRMECLSKKFCQQVRLIFDSKIPSIATATAGGTPYLDELSNRNDVSIIKINNKNRNILWKDILLRLG
jgi:nucleoside-triphosphatase